MVGQMFDAIRANQAQHVRTVDGISYYRHKRITLGFLNKETDRIHKIALIVFDPLGIYTTVKPVGAKTCVFGRIDVSAFGPEDDKSTRSFTTKLDIPTAKLMKYSHHVDGAAHFSDGRNPSVEGTRVKAFPLTDEGRVFEMTANFPEDFESLTTTKRDRAYAMLRANLDGQSLSVTAHWYTLDSYRYWRDQAGEGYGPFPLFQRDGAAKPFQTVLVGPDIDHPTHLLQVCMGLTPRIESETRKSLVIFGGFVGNYASLIGRYPNDFLDVR